MTYLYVLLLLPTCCFTWQASHTPLVHLPLDSTVTTFASPPNASDYFTVLQVASHSILVGGRNALYNLTLPMLQENGGAGLKWSSKDAHRELCTLKGKNEHSDCQNFVRVFARPQQHQIMVCGTNSFKPLCRLYQRMADGQLELQSEQEAPARCPYDPRHSSAFLYTDGQLYSATVADFSGADPLIYRESQRTDGYELRQLNQPAFVRTVEHHGYVLFFFREEAVEQQQCGRRVVSRIGRVCKNDKGGPYPFGERWTSFLKTRLNCSRPGAIPFHFDELQAISDLVVTAGGDTLVYAVMETPPNAIDGSAICAYRMADILEAFEGRFKGQKDSNSNWLPIPDSQLPEQRPGKCVDDSRTLPQATVNFVKKNLLMERAVAPLHGQPLLIETKSVYRFKAIAVDPQIQLLSNLTVDVLYVGTDDGKVLKVVYVGTSPVIVSEQQVLPLGRIVKELVVAQDTQTLIVVGDDQVTAIPMHKCHEMALCSTCLSSMDPHCVWDITNRDCIALNRRDQKNRYAQEIGAKIQPHVCEAPVGVTSEKPTRGKISAIFSDDKEMPKVLAAPSTDQAMMAPTVWLLVVLVVGTMIVGVAVGYMIARHSKMATGHHPFLGQQLDQHRNQLGWKAPPNNGGKDINLLQDKKDNLAVELGLAGKDRAHECKNSTESLAKDSNLMQGQGTLQKVKKTYI